MGKLMGEAGDFRHPAPSMNTLAWHDIRTEIDEVLCLVEPCS